MQFAVVNLPVKYTFSVPLAMKRSHHKNESFKTLCQARITSLVVCQMLRNWNFVHPREIAQNKIIATAVYKPTPVSLMSP